jgi:electron transfer flavoprotein alpha subunit
MGLHALVIAEYKDGKLRQVSLEAVAAARIAAGPDGRVSAALLGTEAAAYAAELFQEGVDRVYLISNSALDRYTPDGYSQAWTRVIKESQAEAIFAPNTAIGRDVAPKVAARIGAGLVSDCIGIEQTEAGLTFTRPVYAGKAFETRVFNRGPIMVTIRPNNIPRRRMNGGNAAGGGDDVGGSAHLGHVMELDEDIRDLRTIVTDVIKKATNGVDLTEAKIVVAGGRGVKSADGFAPLQELADLVGGAVGASRGACDSGYCDYALQIGQTGKVVTPDLYIACGISGAIQHLAGMSRSKVIVAINKDRDAPIFQLADFGIVGDLFEVVPLLAEELRLLLSK